MFRLTTSLMFDSLSDKQPSSTSCEPDQIVSRVVRRWDETTSHTFCPLAPRRPAAPGLPSGPGPPCRNTNRVRAGRGDSSATYECPWTHHLINWFENGHGDCRSHFQLHVCVKMIKKSYETQVKLLWTASQQFSFLLWWRFKLQNLNRLWISNTGEPVLLVAAADYSNQKKLTADLKLRVPFHWVINLNCVLIYKLHIYWRQLSLKTSTRSSCCSLGVYEEPILNHFFSNEALKKKKSLKVNKY